LDANRPVTGPPGAFRWPEAAHFSPPPALPKAFLWPPFRPGLAIVSNPKTPPSPPKVLRRPRAEASGGARDWGRIRIAGGGPLAVAPLELPTARAEGALPPGWRDRFFA
jgi:hypothetical protein